MSRKLDALFAERVLGLTVHHSIGYEVHPNLTLPPVPLRSYTTSLDAAWPHGWSFVGVEGNPDDYCATVREEDFGEEFVGKAETPALALVIAMCRARGITEREINEARR
jgi:hypothetical protein